jgi:Phage integrase, N-terminal SAM-like domain
MDVKPPNRTRAAPPAILPPEAPDGAALALVPDLTPAGQAALDAAQALAKKATAAATLRAYKADWTHFSQWCEAHGFAPVPAAPATVGAYLASLAATHAPTTIRRRLAAIGKMHRFNDLAWNPAHRDIQGPLQGALRSHGRPVRKAAALTLTMLRQLLATCDQSARGRRDRALLLFGFVGAPAGSWRGSFANAWKCARRGRLNWSAKVWPVRSTCTRCCRCRVRSCSADRAIPTHWPGWRRTGASPSGCARWSFATTPRPGAV